MSLSLSLSLSLAPRTTHMSSDRYVHVSLTTSNGKWEYDGPQEFLAHACCDMARATSWLAPRLLPAPEVVVPEATEATEAPEAPEAPIN